MNISSYDQLFTSIDADYEIFKTDWQLMSANNTLDDILEMEKHLFDMDPWQALEACQDSNMVNTDDLNSDQNTTDTVHVISVPMCGISFPTEVDQGDGARKNEIKGKKNTSEEYANCPLAALKTIKKRKKADHKERNGEKKTTRCPQECLKSLKERNKEAARNYRIKKRIRNQDLETEVEFLKKKIALLEEELKCLKSRK